MRILGRLAQLAWFSGNGEVAATRSVAFLLEEPLLRRATTDYLTERSGVALSEVERFVTEAVNLAGNRTDLEGLDGSGKPRLVIEAKFSAHLPESQVAGYMADQAMRLRADGCSVPGLIVVLVPESRTLEAQRKLESAAAAHSAGVTGVVMNWTELITAWQQALKGEESATAGLRNDIDQLSSLFEALSGMVVAPLAQAAQGGGGWRQRLDDLVKVIDLVTAVMGPGNPSGSDATLWHRRYFESGYVDAQGHRVGAAGAGIQYDFADEGTTPLWVRFHKATPGFAGIRDRLSVSIYREVLRHDHQHLWVPLTIDSDMPGSDLVADLVGQIKAIQDALATGDGSRIA